MDSETSEKLNTGRLSIDGDKRAVNDPIAMSSSSSPSTAVKQPTEDAEAIEDETKSEVQQMKLEKSSPRESDDVDEERANASEPIKADVELDSEAKPTKHENQHLQSPSPFNEHADHNQHHPGSCESLAKASPQEAAAVSEAENSTATGKCEDEKHKFS